MWRAGSTSSKFRWRPGPETATACTRPSSTYESGKTLDTDYTAVDFHESWFDAPRYAFLSEFGAGEDYEERANELLRRHVTAVQFYDWMYRHYQLLPPSADYTDILGRSISLASVESAIAAAHSRGMAAIAYGSVYGAEAEYALDRPEELLYDQTGTPISLGGIFYLQDVRPGPWRDRILGEYENVVRRLAFDGIHADQYGTETSGSVAYDHAGSRIELGPALAGLIGDAQARVKDAGADGIIFNFVTNWPLQDAAGERQLATYIEVWPPYTTMGHLAGLISSARCLAPERQVILAAYMSCATEDPDAAEAATLLTSATIHAAGGFHLLLGEGTGILVHAYYPKFVRPGRRFSGAAARTLGFRGPLRPLPLGPVPDILERGPGRRGVDHSSHRPGVRDAEPAQRRPNVAVGQAQIGIGETRCAGLDAMARFRRDCFRG